jgi:plasmid stabilization system protein ParE
VNLRVHFEPEAETEYLQAGVWYERRREGLGLEFFDEVDATIRRILEFSRLGAAVPRVPLDLPVRRLAVRRFPYHVVYLEIAEALRILAVAHDRRRPGYLQTRLR